VEVPEGTMVYIYIPLFLPVNFYSYNNYLSLFDVMLLGTPEEHYLTGFVGVCLIQYFYRKRSPTAFAVLRRLLTWKIAFIHTLPSLILDTVDVVEMAVKVSLFSQNVFLSSLTSDIIS